MNNYEHILAGGIDAMVDFTYLTSCEKCSQKGNGDCTKPCREGQKEWLESEYIEPDSWEKLQEDIEGLVVDMHYSRYTLVLKKLDKLNERIEKLRTND